jgi:hypothetical protein
MKLDEIPQSVKDNCLRSLGVDPEYFGERAYDMAQLRAAWREFKMGREKTNEAFAELYKDLGISIETEHRVLTT